MLQPVTFYVGGGGPRYTLDPQPLNIEGHLTPDPAALPPLSVRVKYGVQQRICGTDFHVKYQFDQHLS